MASCRQQLYRLEDRLEYAPNDTPAEPRRRLSGGPECTSGYGLEGRLECMSEYAQDGGPECTSRYGLGGGPNAAVEPGYAPDYGLLAERFLDAAFRAALCCLRSRSDAEDATQNAMLRLLRYAPRLESDEHARRWLIKTTVNKCRRLATSIWARRTAPLEDLAKTIQADPIEAGDAVDDEIVVAEAVLSLPEKYRMAIHLHYYEGYKAAEIGETLGISTSAATTRLQRARNALRKKLEATECTKAISTT